jgi:glycosyltransferase involved in cell wall biosynthesis
MQPLIPLAKNIAPDRPVLFRSHIHLQSDLADQELTTQADAWHFLWNNVREADIFISPPIPSFVPKDVPKAKVAYMPATTDWLDGLNKDIDQWDQGYYRDFYNKECDSSMMTRLTAKKYIIQIARFDPAKGIDNVLKSYAEFYRLLEKHNLEIEAPQLVIAGHSSIDDPESTRIYDETMSQIETQYPHLVSSISMMRLSGNDQLLNSLLSGSHIVLQLSTREGFEVKVSEASHKGKPVIATKAGGIPLQLQDGKSGFLVEPGDWEAVARHMFNLWTDEVLYNTMSQRAKNSVSDEVGTVGNAMAWFYLADKWGNGEGVMANGRWVNDLARDAAGKSYEEEENKLPRSI